MTAGTIEMNTTLNDLSAAEIAGGVKDGRFTAVAVTEACLARIADRDETVRAWAFLDPDLARAQARAVDAAADKGPLAGVPVGVKDIIDTFDMPTGMGSPIYDGHGPPADAGCVARLRSAGAVILGKTVTCEFAGLTPRETRNPLDPSRTPGGSSSGSAAAVADRMVPVAFGTQTGGSVLRPSSYCGVLGYKPSFDLFSLKGVFPAAESLDTLGLHARTVDDLDLLTAVLTGTEPSRGRLPAKPPVIGLCRTWLWERAQPETREAVERAAAVLADAGAEVRSCELPDRFRGLSEMRGTINAVERGAAMADEWRRHRDMLSPQLRSTIEEGQKTPRTRYVDALKLMEACRAGTEAAFGECDVLLTPCVDGEAPVGLDGTGSPQFQAVWTMLHVPAIALPAHRGPNGLPVAIQLVAPRGADARLLSAARWIQRALTPEAEVASA